MKIFITGISTHVGKSIAAAIVVEALEADYWKPIQAGDLENSDSQLVEKLISNTKTKIHPNSYALKTAVSPHLAAQIENIVIQANHIQIPKTFNHLVIEGAGGVFVPINDTEMIVDLIQNDFRVIIVSRHYLGSINHTLLTIEALQLRNINIAGIIFSGNKNPASESIILEKSKLKMIGRIEEEPFFDQKTIAKYANIFKKNLSHLVNSNF